MKRPAAKCSATARWHRSPAPRRKLLRNGVPGAERGQEVPRGVARAASPERRRHRAATSRWNGPALETARKARHRLDASTARQITSAGRSRRSRPATDAARSARRRDPAARAPQVPDPSGFASPACKALFTAHSRRATSGQVGQAGGRLESSQEFGKLGAVIVKIAAARRRLPR